MQPININNMRSKTSTWFECKVRFEQIQDNGKPKMVAEQYVVDALSFTEAENRLMEAMEAFSIGEFEVSEIKKAPYREVFFMGNEVLKSGTGEIKFYKAKLAFITIDEKTEEEKRNNVYYLCQACSLHNALDNIDAVMTGTMFEYIQASVSETQILDVYEHS